jgi:hypothetical protein
MNHRNADMEVSLYQNDEGDTLHIVIRHFHFPRGLIFSHTYYFNVNITDIANTMYLYQFFLSLFK